MGRPRSELPRRYAVSIPTYFLQALNDVHNVAEAWHVRSCDLRTRFRPEMRPQKNVSCISQTIHGKVKLWPWPLAQDPHGGRLGPLVRRIRAACIRPRYPLKKDEARTIDRQRRAGSKKEGVKIRPAALWAPVEVRVCVGMPLSLDLKGWYGSRTLGIMAPQNWPC